EEPEKFVYQYPLLPVPLIKYDFIHNMDCLRSWDVSLPLAIEEDASDKPSRVSSMDPVKQPAARLTYFTAASSSSESSAEPETEIDVKYRWNSPRLMILCEDGDINCALHYLLESLHDPFAANSVATLLLQESLLEEFENRLKDRLQPLSPDITNHSVYIRTLERLQELQAKTIVGNPETVAAHVSPILVFDFNHRFLGDGPTGIITLHTFRTLKDAVQLQSKEEVPFTSVSIWNEKLGASYELVARFKQLIFLLNCFYVDLEPIAVSFACGVSANKICAGYHYETLTFRGRCKVVVHPVGTIWGKLARERLANI
ncbi:hypothetical protein KR009_011125, partial [Drosophila setifemur]